MEIKAFHSGLTGGGFHGTIFDGLRRLISVEDLKNRLMKLSDDGDPTISADWQLWTGDPTGSVPGPAGA